VETRAETTAELELEKRKARKFEVENEKLQRELRLCEEDLKDFAK